MKDENRHVRRNRRERGRGRERNMKGWYSCGWGGIQMREGSTCKRRDKCDG